MSNNKKIFEKEIGPKNEHKFFAVSLTVLKIYVRFHIDVRTIKSSGLKLSLPVDTSVTHEFIFSSAFSALAPAVFDVTPFHRAGIGSDDKIVVDIPYEQKRIF